MQLLFLSIAIAMCVRSGLNQILFHTLLALAMYCLVFGVGGILISGSAALSRSTDSQLVHPTAVAAAAGLGIVLATCQALMSNKWSLRTLSVLTLPLFFMVLFAAHNRTSLITTPLVCISVILFRGKSYFLAAAGLALTFIGTLYLVADPGLIVVEDLFGSSIQFLERGQSAGQITELSGRAEMWSKMWTSFLDSPLVGHGYMVCSETGTLYVWYAEMNHTAHNVVLQALVSTGLVGAGIFIFWNFKILAMLVSGSENPKPKAQIPVTVVAVGAWFAVWCLLNESMLGPVRPESALYAVATGLVVGWVHGCNEPTGLGDNRGRRLRI